MSSINSFYLLFGIGQRITYIDGEPQQHIDFMALTKQKIKRNNLQHMAKQQPPQWAWDCIEEAWAWVKRRYGIKYMSLPPIRFSYQARFDKFSWGKRRYFNGAPHIRLSRRQSGIWHTYKMKTIGRCADRIKATKQERTVLGMVHELTHYIQHIEGRKYSEVETTQNELDFAKQNYYHLYEQTQLIEDLEE